MIKTYLVMACAALAFVGCARNDDYQGGMRDDSRFESSTIQQSTSTNGINSTTNGTSTGTPSSSGTPGNGAGNQQ